MQTSAYKVQEGQFVALLCAANDQSNKDLWSSLSKAVGPNGKVNPITYDDLSYLLEIKDATHDIVISLSQALHNHTQDLLFEAIRVLKPNGILACYEPMENRKFEDSVSLSERLTLAGFVETKISNTHNAIEIVSKKPDWSFGTSQPIKLKKKSQGTKSDIWKVDALKEDDLVDEKDLLSPEDLEKPNTQDDCNITSTKKACKDCTCGLAEMEENQGATAKKALTMDMLENPGISSSCGSCSLGDAFRCGGCPYRGLPAFKPGEKITLPDDFALDELTI